MTNREHLEALASAGFRRLSLGIQDFDPRVQEAVHRVQTVDQVARVVDLARSLGFGSINFDLIYGLPFQTLRSVEDTVAAVSRLRPDRIAFYAYAHVPWIKPWQRKFTEDDLPVGGDKRALYEVGRGLLEVLSVRHARVRLHRELGIGQDLAGAAQAIGEAGEVARGEEGRGASAEVELRQGERDPEAFPVETPFLEQRVHIGGARVAVPRDAGVAAAVGAERLAERDMDVQGATDRGLPMPVTPPVELAPEMGDPLVGRGGIGPVGNRGVAGVARPGHIVAGQQMAVVGVHAASVNSSLCNRSNRWTFCSGVCGSTP
ncbi:MAG: radical SAM protein [Verrucomicrobiota bacterium]